MFIHLYVYSCVSEGRGWNRTKEEDRIIVSVFAVLALVFLIPTTTSSRPTSCSGKPSDTGIYKYSFINIPFMYFTLN